MSDATIRHQKALLNASLRNSVADMATNVWVGLFNNAPGAGLIGTEPGDGSGVYGYSRVHITGSGTIAFSAPSDEQPSVIDNDADVDFPAAAGGSWGNIQAFGLFDRDIDHNTGSGYAITAVNIATDVISIAEDKSSTISVGDYIRVRGSTGNDGIYTVSGVTWTGTATEITVEEDVTDATVDGVLDHLGYLLVSAPLAAAKQIDAGDQFRALGRDDAAGAGYTITAVDTGTDKFSIAENKASRLLAGVKIRVRTSTGNDGVYTVASATWTGTATEITVNEDVTDATVDGVIDLLGFITASLD